MTDNVALACGCNNLRQKTSQQDCGCFVCDRKECYKTTKWFPPIKFMTLMYNPDKDKKEIEKITNYWKNNIRQGCCAYCFERFCDTLLTDNDEVEVMPKDSFSTVRQDFDKELKLANSKINKIADYVRNCKFNDYEKKLNEVIEILRILMTDSNNPNVKTRIINNFPKYLSFDEMIKL